MAYLTIVIDSVNDTVINLNQEVQRPTKVKATLNEIIDFIGAIAGGNKPASFYVVTRASDPAVTTDSDPNSESISYNNL